MWPWIVAYLAVHLLFGVLIATGVQRACRKRREPFTNGAYHLMVVAWPLVFIAMFREKEE